MEVDDDLMLMIVYQHNDNADDDNPGSLVEATKELNVAPLRLLRAPLVIIIILSTSLLSSLGGLSLSLSSAL